MRTSTLRYPISASLLFCLIVHARVATGDPAATTNVQTLIAQLGSEDHVKREAAHQALRALSPPCPLQIKKAAVESDDAEVRSRCARLVAYLDRKEQLEMLQDSALRKRIDEALDGADGQFLLIGRAVTVEGGQSRPCEGIEQIGLTFYTTFFAHEAEIKVQASGTLPDKEGYFWLLLQPGSDLWIRGITYGGSAEAGKKKLRWPVSNSRVSPQANRFVLLPDLRLVDRSEPADVFSPKDGARVSSGAPPSFRWEPLPEADRYRLEITKVEFKGDRQESVVLFDGEVGKRTTEISWEKLESIQDMKRNRLKEHRTSGESANLHWDLTALNSKGDPCSPTRAIWFYMGKK